MLCRKEVNSIALHPSGRLALSVSQDSSLRLWNLVKGKSAHESTLKQPAEQVAFSPDGGSYALVQGLQVALTTLWHMEPEQDLFAHLRSILLQGKRCVIEANKSKHSWPGCMPSPCPHFDCHEDLVCCEVTFCIQLGYKTSWCLLLHSLIKRNWPLYTISPA